MADDDVDASSEGEGEEGPGLLEHTHKEGGGSGSEDGANGDDAGEAEGTDPYP